jgi:hypothetical protein
MTFPSPIADDAAAQQYTLALQRGSQPVTTAVDPGNDE